MAYVCLQCGKQIKEVTNFIRCPYCGYRVVVKERAPIAREVSTD
ncbi:MAG: DNA-directed RNA polymerase subunit P [Candidatus Micrarchaeia archaeon]